MESEITSPIKAIKEFCRQCNGGSVYEAKNCTSPRCPLFPYRLGKNPYRHTREMTDEQRAEAAERLKKARESKSKIIYQNDKYTAVVVGDGLTKGLQGQK